MRRIVVSGMGAVSPLGVGTEMNWKRLLVGGSGLRHLPDAVSADLGCKVAAPVPGIAEDPEGGFDPDRAVLPKDQRRMDRFILFAMAAADEAMAQAGWLPTTEEQRRRTATIIATGIGGFHAIVDAVTTVAERGPRRLSPFTVPSFLANLAVQGRSRSGTASKARLARRLLPARRGCRPLEMPPA